MAILLKQSTAVEIGMGPFVDSTDGVTPETALTITQPDIRLKKLGGAWAQKNAAQTLAHEENGWYEVALDATDTDTLGPLIVAIYESGALPVWREFMVVPAAVHDAIVSGTGNGVRADVQVIAANAVTASAIATGAIDADSIAADAITAAKIADGAIDAATFAASAINAAAIATGAITAAKFAAGAIDAAAIATGAIDADSIAADAITAAKIANGAIDAATFAAGAIDAAAIADGAIDAATLAAGTITAAKFAAGAIDAAAIATDAIDGDALAASAVTEIQSGLATSAALTTVQSDTDDIQARLPAALVGGRIDASVGAMAAGVVTAAAVATNAIDADALAADAVTEIQAGLATSADVAVVLADTDNIQTRLPAALVGGRMASNAEVVGDKTGYALTAGERDSIATALLDLASAVDGKTLREIFRLMAAYGGGKSSGGVNDDTIRDLTDVKNRIIATLDANGHRTAVTLDLA